MADQKISELTAIDALASGDLVAVVDDPAGTPTSKKATIGQVQDFLEAAQNVFTAKQTINRTGEQLALGVAGDNSGVMSFSGAVSGKVTVQAANAAGTYTLTLPTNDGDAGQFLKTDGSGALSWDDVGTGAITSSAYTMATDRLLGRSTAGTGSIEEISVGTGLTLSGGTLTAAGTVGGSDTQVQFNDAGVFGGDSAFGWNKTTNTLTIAGQATIPLQTLTDAANIDWNCASGAKAKVTLTDNRTMNAVTNAVEGTSYTLWIIQDGTGGRTLTWTTSGAGSFDFGDDGAPTLTTAANEADVLGFEAISIGGTLKLRFVGIKKGFA